MNARSDVEGLPEGSGRQGSGVGDAAPVENQSTEHQAIIHRFKAPGPISEKFVEDLRTGTFLGGPYGSGKTLTCFAKPLNLARCQPPSKHDGWRRCKVYVCGKNYDAVWDKIIPAHDEMWGRSKWWPWIGARGQSAEHTIRLQDPVYGKIELVFKFVAIENVNIEDWKKGLKGTGYYLYEIDTMPEEALDACVGRLHRYAREHWPDDLTEDEDRWPPSCVWGDFNAPNDDNWFYKGYWGIDNPQFKHYHLPGGLDADAENIENIGRGYYTKLRDTFLAKGQQWQVDRFIHNKPGYDRSGEPVYGNFDRDQHVYPQGVPWDPSLPIVVGVDQDGKFAAQFRQYGYNDAGKTCHVIGEIACPENEFWTAQGAGELVKQKLLTEFPGAAAIAAIDPAGFRRSAANEQALSWAIQFSMAAGIPMIRPLTNEIPARVQVERELLMTIGGFKINPSCVLTIGAMATGYKMTKTKGANGQWKDVPAKNHAANIADAGQYASLVARDNPVQIELAMRNYLELASDPAAGGRRLESLY